MAAQNTPHPWERLGLLVMLAGGAVWLVEALVLDLTWVEWTGRLTLLAGAILLLVGQFRTRRMRRDAAGGPPAGR